MNKNSHITLYVDPPSYHFLGDRLFELFEGHYYSSFSLCCADLRRFFVSKGVQVHTSDLIPKQPGDGRNVYVSFGMLKDYQRLSRRPDIIPSAVFAMEAPIIVPSLYKELNRAQHLFKRVYSCSDSSSLERFVGGPLRCEPFRWPQASDQVYEPIWRQTDRKFLVMLNMNKLPRVSWRELYTERMRAVEFFGRTGEIDLYGIGWDGPSYRVGDRIWTPYVFQRTHRFLLHNWQRIHPDPLLEAARRVYRGPALSKPEILGQYTFALCFENMILKSWTTEKIFDCFFAGTIPIYWGAPDITEYVPENCFIDKRKFPTYEELKEYLKSLSQEDILTYKQNARDYLASEKFKPFTKDAFLEIFKKIVEEDTGVRF